VQRRRQVVVLCHLISPALDVASVAQDVHNTPIATCGAVPQVRLPSSFSVRFNHAGDYPEKLRDARYPVELLYYQGAWELTEPRAVAVVGSRKASPDGLKRAGQISRALVNMDFTVVAGLAEGIDTAAHLSALDAGGRTIAVFGTPLNSVYPAANRELQQQIGRDQLVISQMPVLRYARQAPPQNRLFFPERNVTMSALTEAITLALTEAAPVGCSKRFSSQENGNGLV